MDFPIVLKEKSRWVVGTDELKQTIEVTLKNHLSSFIQPGVVGARFDVHSSDEELVEEGVRQTLSQIRAITVDSVKVNLPDILINIEYQGEVIRYQYSMNV